MPNTNALPPLWSVAGVAGPQMSRSPERLSRVSGGVTFNMAPFPRTLTPSALVGGYTTAAVVDVLARFNAAAAYVGGKCAASRPCNTYFSTLGKNLSLSDLLGWSIVFYFWKPVSRVGPVPAVGETMPALQAEMISASYQTSFAQIVVSEFSLVSDIKLAATMVHELAHVAGAPGANDDGRATAAADPGSALYKELIAAEMALKACLLPRQFNSGALGVLQDMTQGWRGRGGGIA
ncbi:hypothetical protein [Sediminicoccus sp. KRV36]|uniref:hypothetical protein n=1 Tax=Sediminicoccus sp. KRV36 TaxID=3133721 RepID=UPI00200DD526|nr:hypothetical protein [Sediminicoccus rosea]UPY34872.1 hypothetical protein LHU95_11565 [Sediminicoccus rosea]